MVTTIAIWIGSILIVCGLLFLLPKIILGLVIIDESQVGVIIKRFAKTDLPPDRIVALNGEAGYQADTLPPGWHLWYWPWMYSIEKTDMVTIPQGTIGLIVARDGAIIPSNRILGKKVECNLFQDARKFLMNGGEKGRQLDILTAGTYRINKALFNVISIRDSNKAGISEECLTVYTLKPDCVGIVTTMDGEPIPQGEIAGSLVADHDNFQNAQAFIDAKGKRGLQEQVLLSGNWNLNPWFVKVEQVPMVEIPIGHVGVVISYVGKEHKDVSGSDFKHGDLVEQGHKGVWVTPLYPGKHPLNIKTMKIELVPTTNIVLNWANRTEAHKYDEGLSSITVRSKDGFAFNLDVSQIIHVGALDAPKVISRVGSLRNLVCQALEPTIGNYFRNSAQSHTVLDFLLDRTSRQESASEHITKALKAYNVEAVDTLIGDINPPKELMQTLIDRKIAEEQKKTYEVQEDAQKQRQSLVREQTLAITQEQIVNAEREVSVAKLKADAEINKAEGDSKSIALRAEGEALALERKGKGEAAAIEAVGKAKAEAYDAGVKAMGPQAYATLQLIQVIGEKQVKVVPETLIMGGQDGSTNNMLLTNLLTQLTTSQTNQIKQTK